MSQWTKYHNERHTDYSGLQRTTTDPADIIIIIIIINCEFSCRCSAARSVRCSALRWLFTSYLDRWWQLAVWSCRRCRTEARSQAAGHADRADHAFCCPDRPTTDRYPTLPALSIHSRPGPSFQVSVRFTTRMKTFNNKCIGDDTKSATRQSLNCIKNKKNMAKNDFQYGSWNSYTLQCGTIMTLISQGDCTLQCGMWYWNRDSEFTKWQYPAMWYVALGWHVIEVAQTSAIWEFYIWFRFRPHHRSRHVILHQSPKFYPTRTTVARKQWRHVDFQDGGSQPSWILGIQLWVFEKPMYDFL